MCTVILWKFDYGHSVYLSVSELNNAKTTVRNFSTTVLSGWVLHDNLLHSGLEHGNFLNSDISQGSVATRLRCGGIVNEEFCCKFTTESVSEKFWTSVNIWRSYWQDYSGLFFSTQCIYEKYMKMTNSVRKAGKFHTAFSHLSSYTLKSFIFCFTPSQV